MIYIDKANGVDGELGGDLRILLEEVTSILAYTHALFMSESEKNINVLDDALKEAKGCLSEIEVEFDEKRKVEKMN